MKNTFSNYLDVIIETKRLTLMPVSEKYIDDMTTNFTAEITKYMWPSAPKPKDEITQHIILKRDEMAGCKELMMMILSKKSKDFLGICSIHNANTETPELGIWLKKPAHGNKYGIESIAALKEWAETHLNYTYLKYPVDKKNIASRNIAESLGGKIEDEYLKKSENGTILDEIEYRFYKN